MTVDLFEGEVDLFKTAKEQLGTWPVTVWEVDHSDAIERQFKKLVGDAGEARTECFTEATNDKSIYRGKVTESIFSPSVASWLLNAYAPKSGLCIDPFAGGGTRAILAAKHGLSYEGTEIRESEAAAVTARCAKAGVAGLARIHRGDAKELSRFVGTNAADFLLTCPPYWNLEKYEGGEADLSMTRTYGDFIDGLDSVVRQCFLAMKSGAIACWVVGMIRGENGGLLAMHHDVARLHQQHGFFLKEEIVLLQKNNGAIQRVGQFSKGHKHLVRIHEYALVFRKL